MANKIETIVRHYVKKFLAETVKDLDALIEQKVQVRVEQRMDLMKLLSETETKKPTSLNEVYESKPQTTPKRKLTPADLGISDDTWSSVYADTLNSGNPILNESSDDQPSADRPEHVPEHVMEQAGFMRDYSKHVQAFQEMDKKKYSVSDEDQKAQELYREALRKAHG